MARYRVDVRYDMGMSPGSETHEFSAEDDKAAEKYIQELRGGWLSPIKRNVQPVEGTLSRILSS